MTAAPAAAARVRRRVDLGVPRTSTIDLVLKALEEFAPRVVERADETGMVRVDLVGPADRLAEILDPPQSRSAGPDGGRVRRIARAGVEARVVCDEVLPVPGAAADPVYPDPAALRRIAVPWDPAAPASGAARAASSEKITVAIVDSGIMTHHRDVAAHLWHDVGRTTMHGRSVIRGDAQDDVEDAVGHGTLLAGVVLAAANRSPAVALMAVKFIDGRTRPNADTAADGIAWAVDHGASVINLSFELGLESPRLRKAIEYAATRGVLVVVAAGNSGADNDLRPAFPACYGHDGCIVPPRRAVENVVTVMATDLLDDKPGFSNYGCKSVHLAAPGMRVTSTHQYLGTAGVATPWRYQRFDGTSAAAACVAGAAAYLMASWPQIPLKVLKDCLIGTADFRPDLRCTSRGRLNVARALAAVEAAKGAAAMTRAAGAS